MTRLIDGIPVLQGKVNSGQVHIWCDICRKYHYHGWPDHRLGVSHRVAHCIKDNSPYYNSGYFIEVGYKGN